jgi:superfamily II DNA or RNA helicase
VDSQRTLAVRDLVRHCEHRLFLSATPHNGYPESFTALLEMVDDHRFARGAEIDRVALAEVAVRRLKSDLHDERFQQRAIKALPVDTTPDERKAYDDLIELLARSRNTHRDMSGRASEIATLLLKKRFLSSPWAFARTAAAYLEARRDGRDLELPEYDDVLGESAADEEEGRVEQPELDTLADARQILDDLTPSDAAAWKQLISWGHGYEARADARLSALMTFLDAVIRPGGRWANERVVIFTEYVDTLEWIRGVLTTAGFGPDRLAVIHGQTPTGERELIRLRFNSEPNTTTNKLRVLLATDAAGEGIDLQRYCHRLVNFDVPFNPNRLEQRIGRIDRYGQDQIPVAYHFVSVGKDSALDRDVDLLRRLVSKMQQIRTDLGSANQVLAPDVESELLGRKPHSVRGRRDTSDRAITEMLQGERALASELTQIATELRTVQDRLHLHPFNLSRVVDTALSLAGQPVLERTDDPDINAALYDVPTSLGRSWLLATQDLEDELTGDRRRLTFDQDAAKNHHDLVHAHLGHPLVRLATRSLRQELWDPSPSIHRVTAVVVSDLKDSFVAAVTRLVLVGGSGVRLHEEVFLAGTRLRRRQALGTELAEELLAATLDGEELQAVPSSVLNALVDRWNADLNQADGLRGRVERAVEERSERRLRELDVDLSDRKAADLARVEATFARFRATLDRSIAGMEQAAAEAENQLFELTGSSRQRRRDISEVRRRLDSLEDELDRERAAVAARYETATPYPFAGALIFALTPGDAEELSR